MSGSEIETAELVLCSIPTVLVGMKSVSSRYKIMRAFW